MLIIAPEITRGWPIVYSGNSLQKALLVSQSYHSGIGLWSISSDQGYKLMQSPRRQQWVLERKLSVLLMKCMLQYIQCISGLCPQAHTEVKAHAWVGVARNDTKITKNYRNCQHSKVHSVQFLAENILLEEETDIKVAWSSIFLQLDLTIMLSVMKLFIRQ